MEVAWDGSEQELLRDPVWLPIGQEPQLPPWDAPAPPPSETAAKDSADDSYSPSDDDNFKPKKATTTTTMSKLVAVNGKYNETGDDEVALFSSIVS